MEQFKGKLLVRRSRDKQGKDVLIFVGIMTPNEPIENYSSRDEMWGVHLMVVDAKKLEGTGNGLPCSPEDFLEGEGQDLDGFWVPKTPT
jgi:hypothetical protein